MKENIVKVSETVNVANTKSISWSSIIAGTLTILSLLLVLNLIGLAIGLYSFDPFTDANPASGLGTGTFIWWTLANLIALFAGGYVAGRVGTALTKNGGLIHGFLSWALYAIVATWLLTSAVGSLFSGIGSLIGGAAKSVTSIASSNSNTNSANDQSSSSIDFERAQNEFEALLRDTEKPELQPENIENTVDQVTNSAEVNAEQAAKNPSGADQETQDFFSTLKSQANKILSAADKDALVNIVKNRTDMTEAEARNTVEQYSNQYQNLLQNAEGELDELGNTVAKKAEQATDTTGSIALWSAIALIVGAIAAAFGGMTGVKNRRKDTAVNAV